VAYMKSLLEAGAPANYINSSGVCNNLAHCPWLSFDLDNKPSCRSAEDDFISTTLNSFPALLNSEYHFQGESIEVRALDAVVQRCLAKDPRDRYGSASEAARDLVPALARCEAFEASGLGPPHKSQTTRSTSIR
jgi:serine/threonine protein kinase